MSEAAVAPFRPLTRGEFEQIRRLAREKFGLDLRNGKEQLVSARLGKKLRLTGMATFEEYCRHVLADRTGEALAAMIDALTTNFTGFFREPAHFDFLRQVVLGRRAAPGRAAAPAPMRIWSAACATGEEPYSIAMCVLEELGAAAASRVRILATDISGAALASAARGIYAADRCDGIPPTLLDRYLLRGRGRSEGWYRVRGEVRAMIDFRRVNLMDPLEPLGTFAAVFCRNVMIYFDRPTRGDLIRRLTANLQPGGWLFVGHAESLSGLHHGLEYVRPAVYRKPASGPRASGRGASR